MTKVMFRDSGRVDLYLNQKLLLYNSLVRSNPHSQRDPWTFFFSNNQLLIQLSLFQFGESESQSPCGTA